MSLVLTSSRLCCLSLKAVYTYSLNYNCNDTCRKILFSPQKLILLRHINNSKVIRVIHKSDVTDNDKNKQTQKPVKPKKEKVTYITLISLDDKQTVTTLEDATKLATRRNLKLVKTADVDSKTGRASYKLWTVGQYVSGTKKKNDMHKKSGFKGDKVVNMSSKIGEHDLKSKIDQISKFMSKSFEVRVVISGSNSDGEKVYQMIEDSLKNNGRIVQKRQKGFDIKFQILPPKKEKEEESNTVDKEKKEDEFNTVGKEKKEKECTTTSNAETAVPSN